MKLINHTFCSILVFILFFQSLDARETTSDKEPVLCQKDEFAGGSGTQQDPWLIATAEHLNNIRNYSGMLHADKHFLLIADIDLGLPPWNEGDGWLPIGTSENRFMGKIDGDSHLIQGLYINRPQTGSIALFGFVGNEGLVKKVNLVNAEVSGASQIMGTLVGTNNGIVSHASATGVISGGYRVGGLVGENNQGTVGYSFADVEVVAISGRIGGLVGFNVGGTVHQSHTIADVQGGWYVGGVVGRNVGGHIALCYATGNISGGNSIGGLAGDTEGGTVTNSYAAGSATGGMAVGGLIGYLWQTTVQNTYAVGNVGGGNFDHGGLIGYNFGGSIANSYWNTETSGQSGSAGGTGKTTAMMLDEDTYTGWDFQANWSIIQDESYPWLQWQQIAGGHNFPFKHIITLQAQPEHAGELFIDPDQYYFEEGEIINLNAVPDEGYVFVKWTDVEGAEISSTAEFDFIMPAHDAHLTASFDTNAFKVSFVVVDEDENPINDAEITLNGNTGAPGEYVFEDIPVGSYAYMVSRQGYFDHQDSLFLGSQDTSLVVVLIEDITFLSTTRQGEVQVFPNPASDKLFIHINNSTFARIRLYNQTGKLLIAKEISSQEVSILPLSDLMPGLYILQLETAHGLISKKLLLQEM